MNAYQIAGADMFRLRPGFVNCDRDGISIMGVDLLDRTNKALMRSRFTVPTVAEIEDRLWRAYGCRVSGEAKIAGLGVVAKALNSGDLARAQVATLLLQLPEPLPGLLQRLHDCGWLAKEWEADEHPRTGTPPNPGWFAPKDDDTDGDSRRLRDQYASEDTGTRTDIGRTDVAQAEGAIDPKLLTQDEEERRATQEETREKISTFAQKLVGDRRWTNDSQYEIYKPGTNKCSVFVAYVLQQAGADPGRPNFYASQFTFVPPVAGQWGNPSYTIPGWAVLGAKEAPEPGDVVAQKIAYSDATGHVMIVGPEGTFIGTGESGNGPAGTIEQIPARLSLTNNPGVAHGPLVYRRWIGP